VEFVKKVPSSWTKTTQTQKVSRFYNDAIIELLRRHEASESQNEEVKKAVLNELVSVFASFQNVWEAACDACAQLDALSALAKASDAMAMDGPVCVPDFADGEKGGEEDAAVFQSTSMRHPCCGAGHVPNSVDLAQPRFLLLTGPNMGGKSTLLRSVCLCVLYAQIGCAVPCSRLRLTAVDHILVRMGARDNLVSGQSTFMVELQETSSVLRRATSRSLVVLDELGRGTSTADGSAVAFAVARYLATRVRARCLFSTHFHDAASELGEMNEIGTRHMACRVADGADGEEQITFLYKLVEGLCPSSYGVNVARLAGVPSAVVARARASLEAAGAAM